ncbi:MAG: hypothetical protein M3N82_08635, partial [Pseudomonadota bacterium]|nr:hypothetical protein [Pseudomonadota bacterium]
MLVDKRTTKEGLRSIGYVRTRHDVEARGLPVLIQRKEKANAFDALGSRLARRLQRQVSGRARMNGPLLTNIRSWYKSSDIYSFNPRFYNMSAFEGIPTQRTQALALLKHRG